MNDKPFPQIAIIGGGAAGLMTAATILQANKNCTLYLFEKNKGLGAKVIISGGGRCNVTTSLNDLVALRKKYMRGGEFLKAALSKFPPHKVFEWFEKHGVPLKTEADGRVFPVSDNGRDIIAVFEKILAQDQTRLYLLNPVQTIQKSNHGFVIATKNEQLPVDYVVICTGGSAYRHTGSSGDGYAFATALGHSLTPLGPSLNSFFVQEQWPKDLLGISLPQARLQSKQLKAQGPLLFTHFGISGPVTFSFSALIPYQKIEQTNPYALKLIPDSSKDFTAWQNILLQGQQTQGKKLLVTLLNQYFPKRFTLTLLTLAKISTDTQLHALSKDSRNSLVSLLSTGIDLNLQQRRPGDEFVTAGGIDTNEVNPQTMESLITPNLYFAGEVLNIDGVTGGYNLQASWATGYLAGKSISKKLA